MQAREIADKKVSEEIAEQKKVEVATETSEQAQQKADERAIAEKRASENKVYAKTKRAEEADAKASAKAAAVTKVAEEKSALAAYEAARKKKAVELLMQRGTCTQQNKLMRSRRQMLLTD